MDRNLVPIRPEIFAERSCPKCGAVDPVPVGVRFPGVHVLGEYVCSKCRFPFYHDLPVGFAVDHDVAIGKETGEVFDPKGAEAWVTAPLLKGFRSPSDEEVRIERRVLRPSRKVVVLNTLDFLYGHVLLKLWNAQHYLDAHPDLGLVLILPRMFEWLVPEGTAEVWLVDQRLGQAHGWYRSIDRQLNALLEGFDEVYLGKGYAHPDKSRIDIARFCGVAPFSLEEFHGAPKHITYVLREDRLWFRSALHKFVYRALGKLGLKKAIQDFFLADQQRLAMASLRRVKGDHPEVRATIVGLGAKRSVPDGVEDLRTRSMTTETELAWCRAYAGSHLVIGVHGSNMLLPTALAAGCIEILPYDRYGNIVQDVAVRYRDVMQLFLYRFVDEFASPHTVARHARSIFKDFRVFHRNNRTNIH